MTGQAKEGKDISPRILVFSTNNISDPGIDLAGSSHMHYPPTVVVISMPCSSGVKPEWVLYAVEQGFDGVFLATDGEECAFLPDCAERTAHIAQEAKDLLSQKGFEPQRVRMSGICSVCAEPFTNHMKEFTEALKKLGPSRKG
ncbi:MAG TPA: hydrogenase iron-sulfur subunit [Spirochaetia bacterium]|nr:hydrogenase iron-sulfur subunit [Spirochaetia bacterium]